MNISKIDLSHYNLKTIHYEETDDITRTPSRVYSITFTSENMAMESRMDHLVDDMQLMNKIRFNSDPAVEEAFKQLLTVIALTTK